MGDPGPTASASEKPTGQYRQYLPDLSTPRFTTMKCQTAHEYATDFKTHSHPPWLHALYTQWRRLLAEPFKGVTNDGVVRDELFDVHDEGIPTAEIVRAVETVLERCDEEQKRAVSYHIDSPEWRTWSNPEFLLSDKGLRLDLITPQLRDAILAVLAATLSPEGYTKAVSAMRINGFLGQLVDAPAICNEFSYNFVLFGEPGVTTPWGFSFYGHHLCLNVFLYRGQMVVSPWFTGAEPNEIDAGPYAGTAILRVEEKLGLKLMQSLPAEAQRKARTYEKMVDPKMPPGRINRDDQRHLCGAYRDNRVVPYEGVPVSDMATAQKTIVSAILNEYFLFLPVRAREVRLRQAEEWYHETYFSWIGDWDSEDAVFYYRIQSPVVIVEFDHHSGVFLTNAEPKRFHVHTLMRTPNGGDYGMALRKVIPGEVEQNWIWEEDQKRADVEKGAVREW